MEEILFFGAAIGALGGAIGVVAARNPFYAVLALVVHLFSLAVLFLLLTSAFVAAAQVVVYAGAVMVLYVFVVAYVGAMGSRRTHDDRIARLREAGLTGTELSRLASPIGLDLGARTPEETAVSIAADIIARRWGGGGRRLVEIEGRIHHDSTTPASPHPSSVIP